MTDEEQQIHVYLKKCVTELADCVSSVQWLGLTGEQIMATLNGQLLQMTLWLLDCARSYSSQSKG
jgi:hypothetical protein